MSSVGKTNVAFVCYTWCTESYLLSVFDKHLNFAGTLHVTITAVRLCYRGRVNPAATVSSQDLVYCRRLTTG